MERDPLDQRRVFREIRNDLSIPEAAGAIRPLFVCRVEDWMAPKIEIHDYPRPAIICELCIHRPFADFAVIFAHDLSSFQLSERILAV